MRRMRSLIGTLRRVGEIINIIRPHWPVQDLVYVRCNLRFSEYEGGGGGVSEYKECARVRVHVRML